MTDVPERHDPAAYLAEDCIVEILSRLPAKQLCRLKCVCRSWRDLISGPVHRLRLARTDAASGFLYHHISSWAWSPAGTKLKFTGLCPTVVGGGGSPAAPPLVDPAFPFLPSRYTNTRARMRLLDSCNGLLLLRCATDHDPSLAAPHYVVCNPGTRSWVDLSSPVHHQNHAPGLHDPGADAALIDADGLVRLRMDWARPAVLAFDPAVSSHFHVIELLGGNTLIEEVRIYSSETREWVRRNTEWRHVDVSYAGGKHAYFNGFLHLATTTASGVVVASVDTAGQTWRTTRVCACKTTLGGPGIIGQSQGRLLYVDVDAHDADAAGSGELSVYALESCGRRGGAERWVLKHRAMSSLDASSGKEVWFGKRHSVVAIHPDCAVIFLFDSRRRSLIAYDMDRGTTRVVHTFTNASSRKYRFFPYVPFVLPIDV